MSDISLNTVVFLYIYIIYKTEGDFVFNARNYVYIEKIKFLITNNPSFSLRSNKMITRTIRVLISIDFPLIFLAGNYILNVHRTR